MSMNPWIVLVTAAALILYLLATLNVATTRKKHGLMPPAMSGHPAVERAVRAQANTLEWLTLFLPSLWMFYPFWGAYLAAGLGVLWIAGRALYVIGYLKDPERRYPGFFIQLLVVVILLIGVAVGAIRALMAG